MILHLLLPLGTLNDAPGRLLKHDSPEPVIEGLADEPSQLFPDHVVTLIVSSRMVSFIAVGVAETQSRPIEDRAKRLRSCIFVIFEVKEDLLRMLLW